MSMTYEAWRITFQSSEQAARAAWNETQKLQQRLDWLQAQAEQGCVTMCFEMEGGIHVTLDPPGGEQRAARNVSSVMEGIEKLMGDKSCR